MKDINIDDLEISTLVFDDEADAADNPIYVSWGDFVMDEVGLRLHDKDNVPPKKVSAPFEILGRARDPNGHGWGRLLRWRDPDQRVHSRVVPDVALHGEPTNLCTMLSDAGLEVAPSAGRTLARYLAGCKVLERVTIVRRTGWHQIGGCHVFVLPSHSWGAREGEQVCLDGVGAAAAYEERGTLDEWKANVCGLAAGHTLCMLAISASFAGPLLSIGNFEGGGIHFVGPSSTGKSTLLQCAASVWGVGGTPGFVRSWRATANGLEGAAAACSDTALILDELGQVEARDAASALYALANGAGKARARRDGSLREPATWRCLVISSGEIPIESKLTEERGRSARAGQLVRLVDVHVDRGFGCGAFDNGGPDDDPGKLAERFKRATSKFCGSAGPEFVDRLVDGRTTFEQLQAQVSRFMADHVPLGADGQVERAGRRFAVIAVAGELATSLGITGWTPGDTTDAAAWALAQWMSSRGGIAPAEERQALERVRLILQKDGESRFEPLDAHNPHPVNGRLGWRRGQGTEREWFISPEMWKLDICAGLDPKFVARTLAGLGMLERANDGFQPVRRIEGRNMRVYVLNSRVLEDSIDE